MATFKELQSQIEKLERQAELARQKEISAIVAQIHGLIAEYGIQPSDLGISARRKRRTPVAAKYQNPQTGDTWSGRGRSPKWLEGKDRTKYEIK